MSRSDSCELLIFCMISSSFTENNYNLLQLEMSGNSDVNRCVPSSLRRRSVLKATDILLNKLHLTLDELHCIWDEAGLSDESRGDRVRTFYDLQSGLLDDMLNSEKKMLAELYEEEMHLTDKINILAESLHIKIELDSICRLELVERIETLMSEYKRLGSIKEERMKKYSILRQKEKQLCGRLDTELCTMNNAIPTERELTQLMERIDKMEKLVESREAKVSVGRHELNVMYARMDRQPTDAFTMNLIKHPSSFVFSEANVDLLNERLEEVREDYRAFVAEFRQRFDRVVNELNHWRKKCCIDKPVTHLPTTFSEEDICPELIASYEAEINRMREYFKEREDVLLALENWQILWREKIASDERENAPNRYQNRGGNLEKELKRRRMVERVLLPKARAAVETAWHNWQLLHSKQSLISIPNIANDPIEYIDRTVREYTDIKQLEKKQKMETRKRQLMGGLQVDCTPAQSKKTKTFMSANKFVPKKDTTSRVSQCLSTPRKKLHSRRLY